MNNLLTSILLLSSAVTTCLPPDVPNPSSLILVDKQIATAKQMNSDVNYMVVSELRLDRSSNREYAYFWIGEDLAIIDLAPRDSTRLDWWYDPGIVNDGIPPMVISDPMQTCKWIQRKEKI